MTKKAPRKPGKKPTSVTRRQPTRPPAKVPKAPASALVRSPARHSLNAVDFAVVCGVHHNTVGNWIKEGLPATRTKRSTQIDLVNGFAWVRARDRAELQAELDVLRGGRDPESAKADKIRAEARLKELDVEEREGTLIDAADVEARWSQMVVAIREGVLGIPGQAVQDGLLEPSQEGQLDAICRDVLTSLGREQAPAGGAE